MKNDRLFELYQDAIVAIRKEKRKYASMKEVTLKFGVMLVQECARIADVASSDSTVGDSIKEHFGVRE